jgi:hypothetical protein
MSVVRTDAQSNTSSSETEASFNRRPLEDVGTYVRDLVQKNKLDLNVEFAISGSGKLTKNGKLEPGSFKLSVAEGSDTRIADVTKRVVEALNEGGYLLYLSYLGATNFGFDIRQDKERLSVQLLSDFANAEKAKSVSSSLGMLIAVGSMQTEEKLKKLNPADSAPDQKDELMLLKNATVQADGTRVVIAFVLPKADARQILERKLALASH